MGDNEKTAEEIEREKEARRAALRAQIAELQAKVTALLNYKAQLEQKYEDTDTGVYTPESEYDLTVSTDIAHWAGDLEQEGEGYQGEIAGGLSTFMSGIMIVIGKIDAVVSRLRQEISQLQSELASI